LFFRRRALEMARRHAHERARAAPAAEQLLDHPRELVRIELAHRREFGAGGAEELAVAAERLLERRRAQPLDALLDVGGVVGVALGVEREMARELQARLRRRIGALRLGAGERGPLQLVE